YIMHLDQPLSSFETSTTRKGADYKNATFRAWRSSDLPPLHFMIAAASISATTRSRPAPLQKIAGWCSTL
ncbi:hypothetical protein M378DRAFT_166156, partial [Amanita muscaria Koide BX008]